LEHGGSIFNFRPVSAALSHWLPKACSFQEQSMLSHAAPSTRHFAPLHDF